MRQIRQLPRYVILIGLPVLFVGVSAVTIESLGEGPYVLVFGLLTTILSVMSVRASLAKQRWPVTSGIVTRLHLQSTPGLFGWREPEQDRVHIEYRYEVDGEEYQREFRCHPTEDGVLRRLGGLPQEVAAVTVHYNRRTPSASSLAPGPTSLAICFLLLGLVGIGAGGYLTFR